MAAYLCPPAVIHGEHAVKTSQIVAEVSDRHPHAAWAPRIDGIAASTGIETRGWMLPLETSVAPGSGSGLRTIGIEPAQQALTRDGFTQQDVDRVVAALETIPAPQTVQERTAPAWEAVQSYGERAARGALQAAGLDASDVDCLITSHSTTPALPGLDIALANKLPLRNDVMLLPATQWACIAGTRSLALAADLVAADPDQVVLVVIAEALSTTYQPADDTLESLIVRLLFADTAVAAVVTGRPRLESVLRLDAAWHHTLPGTQDLHRLETRADGTHFVMDRRGPRAVQETVTAMWDWLRIRHQDSPTPGTLTCFSPTPAGPGSWSTWSRRCPKRGLRGCSTTAGTATPAATAEAPPCSTSCGGRMTPGSRSPAIAPFCTRRHPA